MKKTLLLTATLFFVSITFAQTNSLIWNLHVSRAFPTLNHDVVMSEKKLERNDRAKEGKYFIAAYDSVGNRYNTPTIIREGDSVYTCRGKIFFNKSTGQMIVEKSIVDEENKRIQQQNEANAKAQKAKIEAETKRQKELAKASNPGMSGEQKVAILGGVINTGVQIFTGRDYGLDRVLSGNQSAGGNDGLSGGDPSKRRGF